MNSLRKAYTDWLAKSNPRFSVYATFSFPDKSGWNSNPESRRPGRLRTYNNISKDVAMHKGRHLRNMVNNLCCGRRYRENKTGILSVIRVENKSNRPHLHTLWESHPLLTGDTFRSLWSKALGRWSPASANDVQTITDLEKVAGYVTKMLYRGNTPDLELWIPKKPWQEDCLTVRGVRSIDKAGVRQGGSVNGI
jgi:hypothetical protein